MPSLAAFAARWQDLRAVRLEEGPDGFTRSWIMLMPEGTYTHPEYGSLDFSRRQLMDYKRNFDARVLKIDVALDVNHKREEAPGWLEAVEYRAAQGDAPAGLWGRVRWTPLGEQLLKDQIYRYFSPDLQPYTDERTGEKHEHVLRGGGLVNRPFLKEMPAVRLAEKGGGGKRGGSVSTRPWGEVDKSKLPDSAFLDAKNRRLPIYEGTGPMVNGRYTKRGRLNLHGARAALAAIHGARSGAPMSGLPSGTVERLQRLLAAHEGSTMNDEWGLVRAGSRGNWRRMGRMGTEYEREYELDEDGFADVPDDEGANGEDAGTEARRFAAPKGGKMNAGAKGAKGRRAADSADEEDEEQGLDDGSDDAEDEEAYADDMDELENDENGYVAAGKNTRSGKNGGKKMAEPEVDAMTFAEMRRELADLRAERQRAQTKEQLSTWGRRLGSERALTRRFADAYRDLKHGSGAPGAITLGELSDERGRALAAKVDKLVELALLHGTVDLSRRSSGSFDMDSPERRYAGQRLSEQERGERVLHQTAIELAEHEGKNWDALDGDARGAYMVLAEKRLVRGRQAR